MSDAPQAPQAPQPVNPDDPGRGPAIMGLTWTWTALSLIVVALRFWVRVVVTKMLTVEDWLMLFAAMLNLAGQSCLTVSYHYGFGKHDADLTLDQIIDLSKWQWMQFTPGIMSSVVARTSILILLVRIFGKNKRLRWSLIIITAAQVLASVVLIITSWVQVIPVQGLWNPLIPARRIDPNIVIYEGNVTGALSALGDLLYVLLPVMVVWRLNMPLRQKLSLCVLLALSLFTMAASIAKAVGASNGRGDSTDVLYNASMGIMWAVTEQTFVIMMGCAPPLRSFAKLPQVLSVSESFRRLVSTRSRSRSNSSSTEGELK